MKTSILFPLALTLVLVGCNKATRSNNTATNDTTPPAATDASGSDMRNATQSASNALGNTLSNVGTAARMAEWKLNPSDIQADVDNHREIVRTKESTANMPASSSDKSVVESMVKGRLASDSDIAALELKVSADKQGEVKLSGKAHSTEQVGRAIALALDTEGVTKVTSKIKVDKEAMTTR